jgi:hypothetical protein
VQGVVLVDPFLPSARPSPSSEVSTVARLLARLPRTNCEKTSSSASAHWGDREADEDIMK